MDRRAADLDRGYHEWSRSREPGRTQMLILLGLAVLWAAVLGPTLVRNRDVLFRPLAAVGGGVVGAGRSVGRHGPRRLRSVQAAATSIPTDAASARRRRRDLLITLAGLVTFTLLGGLAVGGVVWLVHFFVDLALVGYVALVTQRHQLEAERRETVVPFPVPGPLMGGLGGASSAMRDEAVLSRRAN